MRVRSHIAGVELANVELRSSRVYIDHVLSTSLVASQEVLQAVNGLVLKESFYPSTPPSEELIDPTLSVLFTKKM